MVSSPATTQIFLTPSFLATGTADRISSSNSSRRAGSGLVIPWPKPLTGDAENCDGRQPQLLVQPDDRVDVLVPPGPEFIVREPGLLDLAKPVQEGQVAPGHLDVDRVGQPRAVAGRLRFGRRLGMAGSRDEGRGGRRRPPLPRRPGSGGDSSDLSFAGRVWHRGGRRVRLRSIPASIDRFEPRPDMLTDTRPGRYDRLASNAADGGPRSPSPSLNTDEHAPCGSPGTATRPS